MLNTFKWLSNYKFLFINLVKIGNRKLLLFDILVSRRKTCMSHQIPKHHMNNYNTVKYNLYGQTYCQLEYVLNKVV